MIRNIIFDLGSVLIDWNPKYLYRKVFQSEEEVDYFLNNICTNEWNQQQDEGRPIKVAEDILIKQFPEYENEILLYYARWREMLGGQIQETVDILSELRKHYPNTIYSLTNWSAETWPISLEMFDFLDWFNGIVVSGQEKIKKPDERIYKLICERYNLIPQESIFIDETIKNIKAAKDIGIETILYKSSDQLRRDLENIGVLF